MALSLKRSYTLDEYSALKTAYGKPYKRADVAITLLKPFVFIYIYTFLLFYSWWMPLILGVLATIYQYRRINIMNARREYQAQAFAERNKFINNLTQILTNEYRTTLDGLIEAKDRTNGEFKTDLTILVTKLKEASPDKIHKAFEVFGEKYNKDVVFAQYLDQLETAIIDGRTNIEILKDIRTFHNLVKEKRDRFLKRKQARTKEFIIITLVVIGLVALFTFSFGLTNFIETYAHTPIGYISNFLFLGTIFITFTSHLKKQEDDEIMEVSI